MEMITISKRKYEDLLETVGVLRNKEMMSAIVESDVAKRKGVKTWKIQL